MCKRQRFVLIQLKAKQMHRPLPWTGLGGGPPRELCSRMLLVLEPASVWRVRQMTSPLWMLVLCCSLHIQSALCELVYDSQQQRALSVKWERASGEAATTVAVVQAPGAVPGDIYQLANGSLVFPRLRERHLGRYVCSANTGVDLISAVVQVEQAGLDPVFFSPKSQRVREGEGVFFQCVSGDSSPPAHITWLKDRQALDVTRGTQIQGQYGGGSQKKTTGTLHLPNVTLEDEGTYVCVTHNPLLNTSTESSSAVLTVLGVPRGLQITQGPQNITVALATKASMSCTVRGFPVPMVQWFKEDRLLTNSSGLSLHNNGQLLVWSVQESDDGVYFCRASSSHLHRSVTSRRISLTVLAPPSVRLWPQVMTVTVGAQVRLQCQVWGNPLPTIRWFKQGRSMQTGGKITVGIYDEGVYTCEGSNTMGSKHSTAMLRVAGDGALRISSVQWSDAGEYHCTAENKIGRQQRRSTLTVTCFQPRVESVPAQCVYGGWEFRDDT
ncbi:protogenin A [Aplochiton taeniatus]